MATQLLILDKLVVVLIFCGLFFNAEEVFATGHGRVQSIGYRSLVSKFRNPRRGSNIFPPSSQYDNNARRAPRVFDPWPRGTNLETLGPIQRHSPLSETGHRRASKLDWTSRRAAQRFSSPRARPPGFHSGPIIHSGRFWPRSSTPTSAGARKRIWKFCCRIRADCPPPSPIVQGRSPDIGQDLKTLLGHFDSTWSDLKQVRQKHGKKACCELNMSCPTGNVPPGQTK